MAKKAQAQVQAQKAQEEKKGMYREGDIKYEPPTLFVGGLPIRIGGDEVPPVATLLEVFDQLPAEEQEKLLADLFYGMM